MTRKLLLIALHRCRGVLIVTTTQMNGQMKSARSGPKELKRLLTRNDALPLAKSAETFHPPSDSTLLTSLVPREKIGTRQECATPNLSL